MNEFTNVNFIEKTALKQTNKSGVLFTIQNCLTMWMHMLNTYIHIYIFVYLVGCICYVKFVFAVINNVLISKIFDIFIGLNQFSTIRGSRHLKFAEQSYKNGECAKFYLNSN